MRRVLENMLTSILVAQDLVHGIRIHAHWPASDTRRVWRLSGHTKHEAAETRETFPGAFDMRAKQILE